MPVQAEGLKVEILVNGQLRMTCATISFPEDFTPEMVGQSLLARLQLAGFLIQDGYDAGTNIIPKSVGADILEQERTGKETRW